jgi:hypothetical protein
VLKNMDIISIIEDEIKKDEYDKTDRSKKIMRLYHLGNEDQKIIINELLSAVCGWTYEELERQWVKENILF